MSWWAWTRVTGAWWIVPALFGVQSVLLLTEVLPSGYVQSDYAQGTTFGIYPSGPLLAGIAAVGLPRLRRFHLTAPQRRRGVVLRAFAPLVLGSACAAATAIVLRVGALPSDGRTAAILAMAFGAVVGCGAWGLAVGRALPTVLAVPVAVALPFWWIAITPSVQGALYRQLSPEVLCCRVDLEVSATYLAACGSMVSLVVAGLLVALAPREWSRQPRPVAAAVAAVVLAGAVGAAVLVVFATGAPVPSSVAEPRQGPLRCGEDGGLRICVWPEQAAAVPAMSAEVGALNARLATWGLQSVTGVDQRAPQAGQITVRTAAVDFASRDELRILVAAGYVAREAGCADGLHGDRAADERVAALALAMGWRPTESQVDVEPSALAAARAVLAPGSTQDFATWFTGGLSRVACASTR